MDAKLKENLLGFCWPLIELLAIGLLFSFVVFTRALNTTALEKTEELEKRLDVQEKMINFLISADRNNCKSDTIIININAGKK